MNVRKILPFLSECIRLVMNFHRQTEMERERKKFIDVGYWEDLYLYMCAMIIRTVRKWKNNSEPSSKCDIFERLKKKKTLFLMTNNKTYGVRNFREFLLDQ